jgi:hypothetical protein
MQRKRMELAGMPAELAAKRQFQLILIKPPRDDDDGYRDLTNTDASHVMHMAERTS